MRFNKIISLNDCLGLSKIDRFYYEDAPTVTPPTGADPKPPVDPANASVLDLSKIDDKEFEKVFDDPRLFKHDRFKSLNEAKKERDQLIEKNKKAEEDRLTKNKEFEQLAENRAKEAEEWKTKASAAEMNAEIVRIAATQGALDLNAVKKLIDRSKVQLDDTGNVVGAEEAVKQLMESSPYLFKKGANAPDIGNGTNPGGNGNTVKRFKLSQLNDARFYRENYKDIQAALAAGMVENDRG